MSKRSGLGDNVYMQGVDLSGDVVQLNTIRGGPALLDQTAINSSARERLGGMVDGEISWETFFNDVALGSFVKLKARPTTNQLVSYLRGTTLGDPAACLRGKQINHDWDRADDGAVVGKVQVLGSGSTGDKTALEWCRSLTAGKVTHASATNGSSIDGGAAQATAVVITSSSVANPTVITTATPHGLVTGDSVIIASHAGSTPTVNGSYTATVTGASTFTVPVNVSVGGTGGTVTKTSTNFGLSAYLHLFDLASGTVDWEIQDSADNSSFAAVTGGGFTAVADGAEPSAERIATSSTATIRRYVRIASTGTFTNALMWAGVIRHLTATLP